MIDKWTVERRFNEFVTFNNALKKKFAEVKQRASNSQLANISFPQLPQKRYVFILIVCHIY
jgi:hypothetical protein